MKEKLEKVSFMLCVFCIEFTWMCASSKPSDIGEITEVSKQLM
jgi:uncharacterized membrane protein